MLMKHLFTTLLLYFSTLAIAQTPCVNGMAGNYPCNNVDLLSYMPSSEVGGTGSNDVWGWVDPITGVEYAILGRKSGTAFIDISDPVNPVFVGNLPASGANSTWRDIKVANNFAFIVSEAYGHGMQVFDLMKLGEVETPPVEFEHDSQYEGFSKAHNLVMNEETDMLYAVGTNTFEGGLHILDVSDPIQPVLVGDFSQDGYTHDAQVVIYNGPDSNFQGKEIAFACNENTVTIADVSDPSDTYMISASTYSNSQYTHQGWLTEDQRYFLVGDELDEYYDGINTTTFIWDVADLSAPQLIGNYVSTTSAIDHNLYVVGDLCYQSNYRAGLRIADISNIANGVMEEVAYFDIYPDNDDAQFNGTWSNYPYFPSGVVAVSSIEGGIFFVQPNIVNEPGCPADFNSDQVISVADLLLLISNFGCINTCETDLDGDDAVNVNDLLLFLIAFGSPC
ncbi:MAG: regulator [Crocinitomicaceae bacterium]|nr:regulator [Crocinitomicaceae bacterium]